MKEFGIEYRRGNDDLLHYRLAEVAARNEAAAVAWLRKRFPDASVIKVWEGGCCSFDEVFEIKEMRVF